MFTMILCGNIVLLPLYHAPMYKPQLSANKRIDITGRLSNILSGDDEFALLSFVLYENKQLNLKARPRMITDIKQDMRICKRRN